MTKPTVTDAMQKAAESAYDTQASKEFGDYCDSGPMRAAITAAIEASGILDRIAELEGAIKGVLNPNVPAREATIGLMKALNKEPTL